jgi:hypothetical protein
MEVVVGRDIPPLVVGWATVVNRLEVGVCPAPPNSMDFPEGSLGLLGLTAPKMEGSVVVVLLFPTKVEPEVDIKEVRPDITQAPTLTQEVTHLFPLPLSPPIPGRIRPIQTNMVQFR